MVRCADCGYLAVRNRDTLALISPTAEHRSTGKPPPIKTHGNINPNGTAPICAVGQTSLWGQVEADADQALAIMGQPRERSRFTKWIPALSPKEHLDMNILDRMDARDQEYRAEQAAHQQERARADDTYRTYQLILMAVQLFLMAAVGFGAAWLGARLTQRGDEAATRQPAAVAPALPPQTASPLPTKP